MASSIGDRCGWCRSAQFGVWLMWLVQFSLLLPSIAANCQGIPGIPSIYPQGAIKVQYGNPLEVFCVDDKYSADDLQFFLGGINIPSEKINSTTRRLYVEKPDKGLAMYYCKNEVSNKLCPTRVLVDTPPLDVTDFACESQNLVVLECSWTASSNAFTKYELSFVIQGHKAGTCKARRMGITYYCTWSTTTQPRYRQLEKYYNFILASSNSFGANEQNISVNHFSVVKPAPISSLNTIDIGTDSALLEWKIPNNMIDLLPNGVHHKIEYQVGNIDNSTYFRNVDASNLPARNKTYRFLVPNLRPHTQYKMGISIRPVEAIQEKFWSDNRFIAFETTGKSSDDISSLIYAKLIHDTKRPNPRVRAKLLRMKEPKTLIRRWNGIQHKISSISNRF